MGTEEPLLKGKNALITGAGKGIGREVALEAARNGANVCAVARTRVDVESLSKEILSSFDVKVYPLVADLGKSDDAIKVVRQTLSKLESIDILVCAAGYPMNADLWRRKLHDIDEVELMNVFNIDVLGSFRVIKHVLPSMIERRRGVVILFSSTPAIAGYDKGGAYTVAKAANLGLAKEIAAEYGEYNIRSYAIAPGNILTDNTSRGLSADEKRILSEESPMKRWGQPREVAEVACVLASDKLSFVTGQTIVVDGGTVMY